MTTAEVHRPLSPGERWYWITEQTAPLNVVAHVRLTGRFPDGLLERAAADLAAEHPLLRVGIRANGDGTSPVFTPSSRSIPVCTMRGDDTEWERRVGDHELTTALDWCRGPLMRVVDVISGAQQEVHDLLLTVSHIIADATTALSLLRGLVEHADHIAAQTGLGHRVASRPVVGAPEERLPATHRGPRGVARLAGTGLADLCATALTRPRRLAPESVVTPSQRRTRLVRRTLTSAQVDALMRRCREEGVTVHGALAAVMAMIIGGAAAQGASGRFCIGSPINYRSDLDPPVSADEVGSYVATVPSIVRFGGDHDVWSIARQINRSVSRRRRLGEHLTSLYGLRFICPRSAAKSSTVFGLLERHGPLNVCISNIGRFGFPGRIGDWQLSGAQFFAGIPSAAYFVAAVNTSHDELFWNFTYVEDVVSHLSATRFADGCVRTLLAAVDSPPR